MTFLYVVVFLLAIGTASGQVLEIEGRYWIPRMANSQVRVEKLGIATDVDLQKDLGVDNREFPEIAASVSWRRSRFRFDFTPIRYSGDHNVSRTIVFNGRTYTFGTRLLSGIDLNCLRFGWSYFFVNAAEGRLKIGSILEANGFLQNLSLQAPALGIAQNAAVSVGAPAIGMTAEYGLRRFQIRGEVAGTPAGRYGYFLRSEAGVRLAVSRHLGIAAGFRTFQLHADYRPDFVRLSLNGPFVGASVGF